MFPNRRPDPLPMWLRWKYHKLPANTVYTCTVAGECVWCMVHWGGASKPCRADISGGKLPCPACGKLEAKRWVGYLPTFSDRGERLVVILSAGLSDHATSLCAGQKLQLIRGDVARRQLTIRHVLRNEAESAENRKVKKEAPKDIRPWLLHLWKDGELVEFFGDPKLSPPQNTYTNDGRLADPPSCGGEGQGGESNTVSIPVTAKRKTRAPKAKPPNPGPSDAPAPIPNLRAYLNGIGGGGD